MWCATVATIFFQDISVRKKEKKKSLLLLGHDAPSLKSLLGQSSCSKFLFWAHKFESGFEIVIKC